MWICGFAHLTAKPEIHRGGPEQERSEGRVPGAIKNVAGYDEQIFPRLPRTNAPVKSDDDYEENDKRERIKEHGEAATELPCRKRGACYASHIEADVYRLLGDLTRSICLRFIARHNHRAAFDTPSKRSSRADASRRRFAQFQLKQAASFTL